MELEYWNKRPKSYLVKWLMEQGKTNANDMARYLDCSKQYFDNKLNRNSFSFEDILLIAYANGYRITFKTARKDSTPVHVLTINEFFNEDELARIKQVKEKLLNETIERNAQIKEYNKLKDKLAATEKELAEFKEKYGIKD